MRSDDTPGHVLDFWLGSLDEEGLAAPERTERWWTKDPDFDREVTRRFLPTYEAILGGQLEGWLAHPRGRMAYVIVLDQLARNMFRNTPRMFEGDPLALRAATAGVDGGLDASLAVHERVFLYMPFMHSEALEHQERSVALFQRLVDSTPGRAREQVEGNLGFARAHRDIVARFGRFPHRNALLGRESTPEELAFLKEPGSSF